MPSKCLACKFKQVASESFTWLRVAWLTISRAKDGRFTCDPEQEGKYCFTFDALTTAVRVMVTLGESFSAR